MVLVAATLVVVSAVDDVAEPGTVVVVVTGDPDVADGRVDPSVTVVQATTAATITVRRERLIEPRLCET